MKDRRTIDDKYLKTVDCLIFATAAATISLVDSIGFKLDVMLALLYLMDGYFCS